MTMQPEDHDSSVAIAELALNQIKALRQSAGPRNYEVWYNYASGHHPSVNQLINELMAANNGRLTQVDIERIYEKYFSPFRTPERIDSAASKFMEQLDLVMNMIDTASDAATKNTENLADVNYRLRTTTDRDAVRSIIDSMVRTAKDMESTNKALETSLKTSKQEIKQLHAHLESVRNESLTDPLTTLANRKCFEDAFTHAIVDSSTTGEPLSLMMADIDHFKNFNDTFGHLIGDQVLRLVALALKQNVKGRDIAARYGGEEFAVVLPETSLRDATTVAEQIRRAVMSKELMKRSTGENLGRVTVSIGVATLRRNESSGKLIERADACLYAAKRNGRNRVIGETDIEVASSIQSQVA